MGRTKKLAHIIKKITIAALQSTHNGVIRFFISPDSGVSNFLMMEILIPETTQSSSQPSYKVVLTDEFHIQEGYMLRASTQLSESFAITVEGTDWGYPL